MTDDSTRVLNIASALTSSEELAKGMPACFVAIGGAINGTIFNLKAGDFILGRNADNQIVLEFEGISRKHTRVLVQDNAGKLVVFIEDLQSLNGTYVNNEKIKIRVELKKGDVVKLGSVALKYLPQGDPERLTYDKLNREANTDGMTGCYNKAYFNHHLDLELKKAKATGNPLSLILFDLDHFKKLNDNYGHDAGDFVLKEFAKLVTTQGIREEDIFCRYGGEEFTIILPKTNLKNAHIMAERIRKLVEEFNFIYDGKRLTVTSSVGVADFRPGVNTPQDFFKRVDSALYQSKNGGRNRVTFYRGDES